MNIHQVLYLLTVIFPVAHSTPCTAQEMCDSINHKATYAPQDVDTPPAFINGAEPFLRYIFSYSHYQDVPDNLVTEVPVILMLEILDNGDIGRIRVLKTPHEQISNEVTRVIKSAKEKFFLPATINGTTVSCWFPFGIHIDL